MSDDLLQPSVGAAPREPREKPWRVRSQIWIAFFGGILAVTAIAILNAKRLGMDQRKRWLMAAAGLVAMAILLALWLRLPAATDYVTFLKQGRELRIYARVIAVALFLLFAAMQKRAESQHLVFAGGEYASLWVAGITATFVLGILQLLLVAGTAWLVRQ